MNYGDRSIVVQAQLQARKLKPYNNNFFSECADTERF